MQLNKRNDVCQMITQSKAARSCSFDEIVIDFLVGPCIN